MERYEVRLSKSSLKRLRAKACQCTDLLLATRYRIVMLSARGWSRPQIAAAVGWNVATISAVRKCWLAQGEAGPIDKREDNGPCKVTDHYAATLRILTRDRSTDWGHRRPTWTLRLLIATMKRLTGIAISTTTMSPLLKTLGVRSKVVNARFRAGFTVFFAAHILQHRLVQAQVRHQLVQSPDLGLELLEPTDFRHAQPRVLLLPPAERRLRHSHLPADLRHPRPVLGVRDRVREAYAQADGREAVREDQLRPPRSGPSRGAGGRKGKQGPLKRPLRELRVGSRTQPRRRRATRMPAKPSRPRPAIAVSGGRGMALKTKLSMLYVSATPFCVPPVILTWSNESVDVNPQNCPENEFGISPAATIVPPNQSSMVIISPWPGPPGVRSQSPPNAVAGLANDHVVEAPPLTTRSFHASFAAAPFTLPPIVPTDDVTDRPLTAWVSTLPANVSVLNDVTAEDQPAKSLLYTVIEALADPASTATPSMAPNPTHCFMIRLLSAVILWPTLLH